MAAGYIFLVVLLLGVLYLLLIRPENRNAEMAVYRRTMFAHRGYHNKEKLIPENSMAAFRAAVAHGYGIELDIHITRDGKVVVFHDDTLERMCGEHGKVEDYTLEELQKFHLLNTTERIPELQEVLEYVDGRVPLLVELKIPGRDLRVCEAIPWKISGAVIQYIRVTMVSQICTGDTTRSAFVQPYCRSIK